MKKKTCFSGYKQAAVKYQFPQSDLGIQASLQLFKNAD